LGGADLTFGYFTEWGWERYIEVKGETLYSFHLTLSYGIGSCSILVVCLDHKLSCFKRKLEMGADERMGIDRRVMNEGSICKEVNSDE